MQTKEGKQIQVSSLSIISYKDSDSGRPESVSSSFYFQANAGF